VAVTLRTEPTYLGRAKSLIAGGFALLGFVAALALGTAGAPALGGVSWVMVTAGAAGVVYVGGALLVAAFVDLRLRTHSPRHMRPAIVLSPRGDRPRSTVR
jgi:hypothetical protein